MSVPKPCRFCGEFPLHLALGGDEKQGFILTDQSYAHFKCHNANKKSNQVLGSDILKSGVLLSHLDFLGYKLVEKPLLTLDSQHLLDPEYHKLSLNLVKALAKEHTGSIVGAYTKSLKPDQILDHLDCSKEEIQPFIPSFSVSPQPISQNVVVEPPKQFQKLIVDSNQVKSPVSTSPQPPSEKKVPRWIEQVVKMKT